jgi:A/G-specific adenine glycosylase
MNYSVLRKKILRYYTQHGRHTLPWRLTKNPYRILVSEVMLQQTQVDRVVPYYKNFLKQFPTVSALAHAPLGDVLRVWQGLGYNRRAKFLHQAAQKIAVNCNHTMPSGYDSLIALPGIGDYTAKAVCVFAYNQPHVVLETNIRAVLLHHFFAAHGQVHDKELLPILEKLVAGQDPRTFYWALMDYGAYLKKTVPNPGRKSRHHVQQSQFEGSLRQIRGTVLRLLTADSYTTAQLTRRIADARLTHVLHTLREESLVSYVRGIWSI